MSRVRHLRHLLQHPRGRFEPYLTQSFELTLPALQFYFHDGASVVQGCRGHVACRGDAHARTRVDERAHGRDETPDGREGIVTIEEFGVCAGGHGQTLRVLDGQHPLLIAIGTLCLLLFLGICMCEQLRDGTQCLSQVHDQVTRVKRKVRKRVKRDE